MGHQFTLWCQRQSARYRHRQALTQLSQGNLAAAQRLLTLALAHHPRPADIHLDLGHAHWQAGNLEVALEEFGRAIALDPAPVRAYGNRGLLYSQRGQHALALADWQVALQHQPHQPLIRYNRGLLYSQQGQHALALADFDIALAADPNLAEAYLHRGNVHEHLGQPAAAVRDWQLALCNDLNLGQARQKLEVLQQSQRDRTLSQRLQVALALPSASVTVQHQQRRLQIQVKRPLGVGINYFKLPDQIRALLLRWQVDDLEEFELLGQGQSAAPHQTRSTVEWRGSYNLFQGQPCPPTRWKQVLLTAFVVFPPLGIPALAYAMNLRQAYRRGDYASALNASKAIQGLCRAGHGIALALLVFALISLGCRHLSQPPEALAVPVKSLPAPDSDI